MAQHKWLALGYNVPVNPSKNRVYIWRKLKEFGATYYKPGVAMLPKNSKSLSSFRSLCSKIKNMGGEASILEIAFLDAADEQEMVSRFRVQSENEYMELMRDCANLMENIRDTLSTPGGPESLKKMVKRYNKARQRDFFQSEADKAAELLADMLDTAGDLGNQLKAALDR